MQYSVNYKKDAKDTVAFRCPYCQDDLRCPLHEAGTIQTCPICGQQFRVPGLKERNERAAQIDREIKLREEQIQHLHEAAARAQEQTEREREEQKRLEDAASDHYILQDGKQSGPYTLAQVQAMYASGAVTARSQWRTGVTPWQPFSALESQSQSPKDEPLTPTPRGPLSDLAEFLKRQNVIWGWAFTLGIAGGAIAEFTGIGGGLAAIAEPFSPVRNEIAKGYAAVGLVAGLIIGGARCTSLGKRRSAAIPLAGAILCIFALYGILFVRRAPVYPASHESNADESASEGARDWLTPDLTIEFQNKYTEALGEDHTRAFAIRNNEQRPLTIQRVSFNGEFNARPAEYDGLLFHPLEKGWPMTLGIGDIGYAFINNHRETDYAKNVIFIDLYTDRGAFRYRDGTLKPLRQ